MDLVSFLSAKVHEYPPGKRNPYRKDLLKALILSYPKGYHLSYRELKSALNMRTESTCATLLSRLRESGDITFHGNRMDGYYTVDKPVADYSQEMQLYKVQKGSPEPEEPEQTSMEPEQGEDLPTVTATQLYDLQMLEREAMRFAFYERDRDVAGFLSWLGKR